MDLTSRRPRAVLTAAEMRAAEIAAIREGATARALMERAGADAARAILAFDPADSAVVVCGPGNNGGDGYVVARHLAAAGVAVVVAAAAPSRADPARAAAADWAGSVVALADAAPAALLIDALYGIGLTRALAGDEQAALDRLAAAARTRVALDLPSGAASDDGGLFGAPPRFDLTIAFGALKPAHCLEPARSRCGRVVVAGLGLDLPGDLTDNPPPRLRTLDPATHKFARGHLIVVAGPSGHGGAARLAALAGLRAGAGLVTLAVAAEALAEHATRLDAVMLRVADDGAGLTLLLDEPRVSAAVIGPGLGHDARARGLAEAALAAAKPLVLDGDVFTLFAGDPAGLAARIAGPVVLTPHEGEFARLFGELPGSKVDRARAAAALSGAVVVLKGPDTVIAAPDGRARINCHAAPWLATAGSGDVLAGIAAGLLAQGGGAFDAACAGVWLHGDCGVRGGPGLTADDLPGLLPAVLAGLA